MVGGLNPIDLIYGIPALLVAITVHEFAHGYVAEKLGDPTPRSQGRLTLNPMKHLDLFGAISLVVFGFGWAKPVQVNAAYFNDRKKGMAYVGLAGPVSNLIVVFLTLIIIKIFGNELYNNNLASNVLAKMVNWNLGLAVFNLLPIPPLDGSKIFAVIMPPRWNYFMNQYESYGQVILLILLFMGFLNGFLGIISTAIFKFMQIIIGLLPI